MHWCRTCFVYHFCCSYFLLNFSCLIKKISLWFSVLFSLCSKIKSLCTAGRRATICQLKLHLPSGIQELSRLSVPSVQYYAVLMTPCSDLKINKLYRHFPPIITCTSCAVVTNYHGINHRLITKVVKFQKNQISTAFSFFLVLSLTGF